MNKYYKKLKEMAGLAPINGRDKVSDITIPNNSAPGQISYSQSGEDLIIKFIFDALNIKNPTYVDIGAHHPRYINNTAIFYNDGSTGINIEPDPDLYKRFVDERPNDINLNLGIGKHKGVLTFYIMSTPTLNTFSLEEAKRYEKEGFSILKTLSVNVDNINDVIKQYVGKAPGFVNLDVEGIDFEILKSYDFKKYSPTVWCIETISFSQTGRGIKDNKVIKFMGSKGYMLYADTQINSIFVKKAMWLR